MDENAIPDEVRQLIAKHIDSVEQLEVLLLLYRQAARDWTAVAVSAELRTSPTSVAKRLDLLAEAGLIEPRGGGTFRYRPHAERDAQVGRLARAYEERRVTVITLIFSKPQEAIRTFADAFRWKKGDSDG